MTDNTPGLSERGPLDGEAKRLAALHRYAVLDTPGEPGFDDIVRIAAQICGTPMALISLVDDRRQWFKAALGVDASETPREIAFCAHAIEQRGVFTVADATRDPGFAANPLVTGETGLRFYAGAPLVTPEGYALGTLCVLDRQPRTLTPEQDAALAALARQVMAQLELRRALARHEADEAHRRLLVEELRHRGRNTLAVVQAIVSRTLRDAVGPAEARAAIDLRLRAMADAHDLLARTGGAATRIADIVATAAEAPAARPQAIVATGPDIALNARAALSLSMAIHELSTNATKHGALSVEGGHVEIGWRVGDGADAPVEIVWQESGGPPVGPPTRRGFGTRLIAEALPRELGGAATLDHDPAGVRWRLTTTLDRLV